jgi:hypothetical protein
MNGVKMPNLEYIGSLAHYHGPCEIMDIDEYSYNYITNGTYAIYVREKEKILVNVRPQSILIIQD